MTVAELSARMGSREFIEWNAHDQLSAQEREEAEKRAEQKASVKKR